MEQFDPRGRSPHTTFSARQGDDGWWSVECIHPKQVAPLLDRVIGQLDDEEAASTFGLLADPTRARILHALCLAEELCVCDLALLLGISQSALSHQLRLLRGRRAVARGKVGRIVYYRLADEHIRHVFHDGLIHAGESSEAIKA